MARALERVGLLLAALAIEVGFAGPARADLDVGETAPPVAPVVTLRSPAPTPATLRGRVALLEFFKSNCPHCQAEVVHLNALHRAYAKRGLVVAAICHEGADAAQAFARQHGVEFALSATRPDVLRDFDVPSYPRAVLIDPAGHVLWRGHPSGLKDADVDAALAVGGIKPPVPSALAWVDDSMERGEWAAARARLEQIAADAPEPTDLSRAAGDLALWIGWLSRARRSGAERDLEAGRVGGALETLRFLAKSLAGTPAATEAAGRRAEIEEDPARRAEVDAWAAYLAARAGRETSPEREALEAFRAVVTKWPDTRGALRSAVYVKDLEKRAPRPAPAR